MSIQSTIQCPYCDSSIIVESSLLLSGSIFHCPNPECSASVSLSPDDQTTLENAVHKFEELKEYRKHNTHQTA
jgi:hypothetical protein